ncbi:MAG: hypothetical protein HYR96_16260 [Deltaproteobacteria bacterium]|nr:hypothetical protein [Deltaproteobacteria bacterium]MBI3295268.1 hypothetical protein [Deltaproteobacteria bacterium]
MKKQTASFLVILTSLSAWAGPDSGKVSNVCVCASSVQIVAKSDISKFPCYTSSTCAEKATHKMPEILTYEDCMKKKNKKAPLQCHVSITSKQPTPTCQSATAGSLANMGYGQTTPNTLASLGYTLYEFPIYEDCQWKIDGIVD